ncbi:MAG: UDP-N-acetylglucosamine 2-epimerase [Candidatus Bathyarchaeia archaeon]
MATPCVTLRHTTEWAETVALGANTLVGDDEAKIVAAVRCLIANTDVKRNLRGLPNPFGDGKAAVRVVEALRAMNTTGG